MVMRPTAAMMGSEKPSSVLKAWDEVDTKGL